MGDPVVEGKGKVGAEYCDRSLRNVCRRSEFIRHVHDPPSSGRKRTESSTADSRVNHMLRTITHQVTSAHETSFLPDVAKRDVCIVFDFRRYQRGVFEPTMHAHTRGAKILVITEPWFSQAAEVADLVLPVTVDGLGPFDSVVPATAIVESLVAGKLGKRADRRIREAMSWPRALWSTAHVPFPAEIALVLARRAEGRCVGWRLETRSVQCAKSVVPMDCSWVTSAGGRTSTRWNHEQVETGEWAGSTEERHRQWSRQSGCGPRGKNAGLTG